MPIDPDDAIGADRRRGVVLVDRRATCCSTTSASARAPARATTSTRTRCATPSTGRASRCCRRSASWPRRSTRPTRRRWTCPAATSTSSQVVHGSQAISVRGPLPTSGSATVRTTLTDIWDKGKAAVIWQEGVATVRVRRGAVDHPLVDLRARRGRLGRRPRRVRAGRAARPRAGRGDDVRHLPAAGAALPPLRRPQPAALRPRLRQGGRVPRADPARSLLLRDRAPRADRRAARRRRDPGRRLRREVRRRVSTRARRSGSAAGARTAGSWARPRSPARETATARPCSATSCSTLA